jgi:hypothetical protein
MRGNTHTIKRISEERAPPARIIPVTGSSPEYSNERNSSYEENIIVVRREIIAQYNPNFFFFKMKKPGNKKANSPKKMVKNTGRKEICGSERRSKSTPIAILKGMPKSQEQKRGEAHIIPDKIAYPPKIIIHQAAIFVFIGSFSIKFTLKV